MRIGCTGHQSLSSSTRRDVTAAITQVFANVPGPIVGITNLAEGADQIFALSVLAAGGHLHAVIPSSKYEQSFESEQARSVYSALLSVAQETTTLPFVEPSEDAYLAAGHHVADHCDMLIAVWDGNQAAGKGGTGDIVAYARERGIDVRIIWPSGARRS